MVEGCKRAKVSADKQQRWRRRGARGPPEGKVGERTRLADVADGSVWIRPGVRSPARRADGSVATEEGKNSHEYISV